MRALRRLCVFLWKLRLLFLLMVVLDVSSLFLLEHTAEDEYWPFERAFQDESSMSPSIYLGQAVIYMKPSSLSVKNWTGWIVWVYLPQPTLFPRPSGWEAFSSYMHRCIWDNGTHIVTKGDNPRTNPVPEPWYVPKSKVEGLAILVLPRFDPGNTFWNWRLGYLLWNLPFQALMAFVPIHLYTQAELGETQARMSRLWRLGVVFSFSRTLSYLGGVVVSPISGQISGLGGLFFLGYFVVCLAESILLLLESA